jgi:uncharacterized protein (TIGR00369 family)
MVDAKRNNVDALQRRATGFFAAMLGVRFVEATPERVVAELAVRDELCTTPGIMHGGAIMAFADELGGTAAGLNLPRGAGTTTIESKTNFFAPARTGETIRAECVPLHRGKQTMVWQTRITRPDGRVVALVTQTQIVLQPVPQPEQALAALFEGKSVDEQKQVLARLERGGAAMYRQFAASETDDAARRALLAAADREDENAISLES